MQPPAKTSGSRRDREATTTTTGAIVPPNSAAAAAAAAAVGGLAQRAKTAADMFDLAAPSVEDPLVARLVPSSSTISDNNLKSLLAANNVVLPRIDIRAKKPEEAQSNSNNASTVDIIIGRSSDLKLPFRIDYARLSSEHLKIRVVFSSNDDAAGDAAPTAIYAIDTSTNGVWVNGERLKRGEPHELHNGDVIALLNPQQQQQPHLPFTVEIPQTKQHMVKQLSKAASVIAEAKKKGGGGVLTDDQIELFKDEITCSICFGTYVRPTCVLPCLHTFCGPCTRQYVAEKLRTGTSSKQIPCPDCRVVMTGHSVNHKIQALIQQVTAINPSCARPQDEIEMLEQQAKDAEEKARAAGVKSFDLGGKKHKIAANFMGDDDEDDEDWSGSDGEDGEGGGHHHGHGGIGGFLGNLWNNFVGGGGGGGAAGQPQAAPAPPQFLPMHFAFQQQPQACESCSKADPRDGFQCPPGGQHLVCKYCKKIFPDRPAAEIPQRCKFCATPFCDLYCGPCKNPAGVGVLKKLEEQEMDSLPMGSLFKGNVVEQQIFQAYVSDHNLKATDLWTECIAKFKSGEWTLDLTAGMPDVVQADTPLCHPCAQRVFSTLLIRYRMAIPRDRWPPAVGARPDCWYGIECRTQHHNPQHAQNYNHVCIPRKGKE